MTKSMTIYIVVACLVLLADFVPVLSIITFALGGLVLLGLLIYFWVGARIPLRELFRKNGGFLKMSLVAIPLIVEGVLDYIFLTNARPIAIMLLLGFALWLVLKFVVKVREIAPSASSE